MDGIYSHENWMEQPITFRKIYVIPQGIEGEGVSRENGLNLRMIHHSEIPE
jgi:hypothetical protein